MLPCPNTWVTPEVSLTIMNVSMSVFVVAIGGEPPDHLTPVETATPSTLQASPYIAAVLASIITEMVTDCPFCNVVPLGSAVLKSYVLIALVGVVPTYVLAAAV